MTVTVLLSQALICFAELCHPALVGDTTPTGVFEYFKTPTDLPYYGGSIAPFAQDPSGAVFAIHKTWLGTPAERRDWRIKQSNQKVRVMTKGCVNVAPVVYDALPDRGFLIVR